jgi:hypothetical protein
MNLGVELYGRVGYARTELKTGLVGVDLGF